MGRLRLQVEGVSCSAVQGAERLLLALGHGTLWTTAASSGKSISKCDDPERPVGLRVGRCVRRSSVGLWRSKCRCKPNNLVPVSSVARVHFPLSPPPPPPQRLATLDAPSVGLVTQGWALRKPGFGSRLGS